MNILDNDKDAVVILGTQDESSPQGQLKLIYLRASMDPEKTPKKFVWKTPMPSVPLNPTGIYLKDFPWKMNILDNDQDV